MTAPALASLPTYERDRRLGTQARHLHGVSELLQQRGDLQGVHPLADLIFDGMRWSP